jgi:hypothetical protein
LGDALARSSTDLQKESITSAYEALATVGRRLGKKAKDGSVLNAGNVSNFEIGEILAATVDQSGKTIGYARASGIADGKKSGELLGFDPVAFPVRMIKQDRAANKANIEAGMQEYLGDAKGYVPASKRKKVIDELKKIQAMTQDEFDKSIFLEPGTPLYDRHANTAKAKAMSVAQEVVQANNHTIRNRLAGTSRRAISVFEYKEATKNFLNRPEISELFEHMQEIGEREATAIRAGKTLSAGLDASRRTTKAMAAMKMATGIRAIRDTYPSGNILDVMDTLESEILSIYGQHGRGILQQLGAMGEEDQMMDLFNLATNRRSIIAESKGVEHFNYVQQLYRDHQGSASADLSKVTPKEAGQFVRFDRNVKGTDRRMASDLFDFMRLRARSQTLGQGAPIDSLSANEAFNTLRLQEASAQLEERVAEIAGSSSLAGPAGKDAVRLTEELASRSIDDAVGPIARSPYKRIAQSFQGGELKKLLESKNARRSGVAAIALIGASFLYQRNKKKDLTESSVSGPPLMPGGSAYEDRPPTRQMALQSAQTQSQGYGMQYQVNTTGSMGDLNRLRGLFGGVVDGPINSTIYNGMPSLGKDPYSDIASNF